MRARTMVMAAAQNDRDIPAEFGGTGPRKLTSRCVPERSFRTQLFRHAQLGQVSPLLRTSRSLRI